jgi:hypothetical protein
VARDRRNHQEMPHTEPGLCSLALTMKIFHRNASNFEIDSYFEIPESFPSCQWRTREHRSEEMIRV